MITMNPVVLHGRSVWDQDYFPIDEKEQRLSLVREEMARRGLRCLLVFGHSTRYDDLCYLTQYIPMHFWGLVVVPIASEPVLVLGHGGSRDIPATRARTWFTDVRSWPSLGSGLRELLAEKQIEGPVGLIGAEHSLPAGLFDQVLTALGTEQNRPAEDLVAGLRRRLRPREISAVREAARIVKAAADSFIEAYSRGLSNAAAMVEAEGTARKLGAYDFRGLTNLSANGQLEPVDELSPWRSETAVAYLAVNFLGYWADLGLTARNSDRQALEKAKKTLLAMVENIKTGAAVSDVAKAAIVVLGPEQAKQALVYGLGNGLGLSTVGSPLIEPESNETLVENSLLSLRVWVKEPDGAGLLVTDIVLVKDWGCESILS